MAVNIAGGQISGDGGAVVETIGGTKTAVFSATAGGIVAYKDIDGTPAIIGSAQSEGTVHGGGGISDLDAAIDGSDVVHVVSIPNGLQTRDIAYNTISDPDGTPAWGSWVEAAALQNNPTTRVVSCAVDGSGVVHILFTDGPKVHGTTYDAIYYVENSSGWSTPVMVSGGGTVNYSLMELSMKASDNGECIYHNLTDGDQYYSTLTSGTWSAEASYTETASTTLGIAVDTGGAVRRLHLVGGSTSTLQDIEENNVDVAYNTVQVGTVEMYTADIAIDGTDRYIFYIDTNNDVHLISNDGGGWTDEGVLQTGTFNAVIAGWSFDHLNNTATIDYLYDDGTDVFWDEFTLAAITTYFQSIAGTLTTGGTVAKKGLFKRAYAGAVGFAGTLTTSSLFKRAYAGAVGFAGNVAKKSWLDLSGALNFAGNISTSSVFSKALAGALSFAGNLATRGLFKRALGGSMGFAGTLAKSTKKTVSGALGFTGTIAKGTFQSLAGSLGFSGDISYKSRFTKALAGAVGFAGDLSKKSYLDLSGALGFAGALAKKSFLDLSGALSFAGDLTPVKDLVLYFQSLAGSLGFSGDLSKKSFLDLSGALGFAGDIVKKTSKSFAGVLGFGGALAKKSFVDLAGTLTSAGTVAGVRLGILFYQAVAGSLGFAGDISKKTSKSFAGAIAYVGSLAPSGRFKRLLGGTLAMTGDIRKKTLKTLLGDLDLSGILTPIKLGVLYFKSLAGSLGFSGDLLTSSIFKIALAGSLGFSGDLAKKTLKKLAGALDLSGAIAKKTFKSFAGSLTMAGNAAKKQFLSLSGSIGFVGVLSTLKGIGSYIALTLRTRGFDLSLKARYFALELKNRVFDLTLDDKN